MKKTHILARALSLLVLAVTACSTPGLVAPGPGAETRTPAASATETPVPSATAIPEPTFTPTPAILPLEIVEWHVYPYANLVDPANTDTHVEALIRNPNDFPVRVNRDEDELMFVNAAGEAVYTNPSPHFYIWQGDWMLPGETAALSACACFWTSGTEKQDWESLELVAPLEIATDIAYTLDVEMTLGEFFNLADAHLGGNELGAWTTLTNNSDQVLESIATRVLARDTNGRYVGVATYGNAVASFTEDIGIQPGDTATGVVVSDIDYIDMNVPLRYEVAAIGIPAESAATEEFTWPTSPAGEWKGIPIMADSVGSEIFDNEYQYATQAGLDEIVHFYETELAALGFELDLTLDENAGSAILTFSRGDTAGKVAIAPYTDGVYAVIITLSP